MLSGNVLLPALNSINVLAADCFSAMNMLFAGAEFIEQLPRNVRISYDFYIFFLDNTISAHSMQDVKRLMFVKCFNYMPNPNNPKLLLQQIPERVIQIGTTSSHALSKVSLSGTCLFSSGQHAIR